MRLKDEDFAIFVEAMNTKLGTELRSEPFDLTKVEDLNEAIMLAVGAYCDYSHYHDKLCDLDERFDESLEHYETDTWFYIGQSSDKADDLTSKIIIDRR